MTSSITSQSLFSERTCDRRLPQFSATHRPGRNSARWVRFSENTVYMLDDSSSSVKLLNNAPRGPPLSKQLVGFVVLPYRRR